MFKLSLLVAALCCAPVALAGSEIEYWDTQRRGANYFNTRPDAQWFIDAKAAGIPLVRLTFSKWSGAGRDFLIGDADHFKQIPSEDLAKLRSTLDEAHRHGIRIVIAPLSLPGSRWRQQNGGKFDPRLWQDLKYHEQSSAFWRQLADALNDHPAVVGYEILNEPAPERAVMNGADEWTSDLVAFQERVKGTAADINELYRRTVAAIREVDRETPIVLSSGFYGFAGAMPGLEPIDDPAVIYTFHTYEPYAFTNHKTNASRFSYPGEVATGERMMRWDKPRIRWHVTRVHEWATKHRIAANRIFVGEFGCDRRVPGVAQYLRDSIEVFNEFGWHWAFYAFRENEWDALDYELGDGPLGWGYWQAKEQGQNPPLPRKDNPIWQVLQQGLRGAHQSPPPLTPR